MAKRMAVTILVDVPDEETKESVAEKLGSSGVKSFNGTAWGWKMPDGFRFFCIASVGKHRATKPVQVKPKAAVDNRAILAEVDAVVRVLVEQPTTDPRLSSHPAPVTAEGVKAQFRSIISSVKRPFTRDEWLTIAGLAVAAVFYGDDPRG